MPRLSRAFFTALAFVVLCLGSATLTYAETVTFDFEDQNPTFIPPPFSRPGALTTLIMSRSTLVAFLARENFERFDVVANVGFQAKPPQFGSRSLDPFFDQGGGPFVVGFSQPVDSVSIDMGDYGGDTDTLTLEALEVGTLAVIGVASGTLPPIGNLFTFSTLTVTAPGRILAVRFNGSGSSPNSVFYDNLRVTFNTQQQQPIPEPMTMLLLGTGLVGIAAKVRKRRLARKSEAA